MSKYIRAIVKDFEFEGQTCKVELKPIEYGDFLALQDFNPQTDPKSATLFFQTIVRKYASFVVAPTAADGSAVSIDEVCSQAYFMELMASIGRACLETGRPANP